MEKLKLRRKKRTTDTDYEIVRKSTGESIGDYSPKKKQHLFYIVFYRELAKESLMLGIIGEMDARNKIMVDARLKSVLASHYNTTSGVIQNTLNRMVKSGWALRLSRGQYFVSPYLFYKSKIEYIEFLRAEYDRIKSEQKESKPMEPHVETEHQEVTSLDFGNELEYQIISELQDLETLM